MFDLPQKYNPRYVKAEKQISGKYKLFWTGTINEVFPGELFYSPQEARQYLKVQIFKQYEHL